MDNKPALFGGNFSYGASAGCKVDGVVKIAVRNYSVTKL